METLVFFVPFLGSESLNALRYTSVITVICAAMFAVVAIYLGVSQLVTEVNLDIVLNVVSSVHEFS